MNRILVATNKFTIANFILYLKNPKIIYNEEHSVISNVKYVLNSYFFCLILSALTGVFLVNLDHKLVKYFGMNSIYEQIKQNNTEGKQQFGNYSFLIIIFIGPIVEEIIFRLPLNLKRTSLALAISLLLFRLSGNSITFPNFTHTHYWISLLLAFISFILISYFFPVPLLESVKSKHYRWWYYFGIIAFGLVHISNIKILSVNLALLYPLFVLPQIIMGAFISNIRMHRGFLWGIVLHGLINMTSYLLA